jgi:hypothetical protein
MFKAFYISLLAVIALSGSAYAGGESPPMALDQITLDLTITLTSGETVTLQQFKGNKPVYLKFNMPRAWACWGLPTL